MALTKLFTEFVNSERAGGLVLMAATAISLTASNLMPAYSAVWHIEVAGHHIVHWINDGLMTIFFLLIGLELEREIYIGELSGMKNALLPMSAAVGGMAAPALVYYLMNTTSGDMGGIGVPMATDIAFALAILALLGKRVPHALKIFLTALAVADDLGAIIIIALFYTDDVIWSNLLIALAIFAFLLILNRLKVHTLIPYLVLGIAMWYFMLHSGIHATITGVLLAFAIPFGNGDEQSPSYGLQHWLHKPVAFFILPLFALANTSIIFNAEMFSGLISATSIGIMLGLLVGKPLGIFTFSMLSYKSGLTVLPSDLTPSHILGAGILGGIGFTMSIFISLLAFEDAQVIDQSKAAVMAASIVAGTLGWLWLVTTCKAEGREEC
jgi:Na+:H+ antiporter, NhaA family